MRTSGVDGIRAPGRECTVLPGVTAITVAQDSTPINAATLVALLVRTAPPDNIQAPPAPAGVKAAPLANQAGQDPIPLLTAVAQLG